MDAEINPELKAMLDTHPCYNECAHRKFARMHLPVAPQCNIQCNYCNRKYDCSNESRPGVTSEILTAEQAVEKIRYVKERIPYLSVLGIAGPGDPMANEETFKTLKLVHEEFPDMTLCLSTNGLNLPSNVERLKGLGVKFITITINAIDPEVGAKMYEFVRYEGKTLRGVEAAKILIDNQLAGLKKAAQAGMLVKVNSVMVPGINASHLPAVAKRVKELGAYIVNILPLIPVPGTDFENQRAPTAKERKELQDMCEVDIIQMRHCRQCRADAIGLLDQDRAAEFAHITCPMSNAQGPVAPPLELEGRTKYKLAVATTNGKEVDLHFGFAETFYTYTVEGKKITPGEEISVVEQQKIPLFGPGHRVKIENTVSKLEGFDGVISTKYGEPAIEMLREKGIIPITAEGEINKALRIAVDSIYKERSATFE